MSDPKLAYRMTPPAAFVSTTIGIVVTATNSGKEDIKFAKTDDIKITFPGTMVLNQNFAASAPEGSGYSVSKDPGGGPFFVVKAPFGLTLKPGDSIVATFSQVPMMNTADPNISVAIAETIGGTEGSTDLPFQLQAVALGIIAWLDKKVVGKLQPARLFWQTTGGVRVVVTGFPTGSGEKTFPVTGEPPYQDSTIVYVPVKVPEVQQWNYTLTVYTGAGNHEQTMVTLQQNKPIINFFGSDPAVQSLRVDESATLNWHVQLASSVVLTTPSIPNWRQPARNEPVKVSPGEELRKAFRFNFSQLPQKAVYILTANGFDKAATETVCFTMKPVPLLYFKFTTKGGPVMKYRTDPENWNSVFETVNANLATFTIYQPGGTTEVYYLGSGDKTHPQIQFFDFTKKGDKFQLEWVTANLKTLVLNPGNIQFSGAQIANGTQEVAAGTYTLTGTAEGNLSVNSVLQVSA